MSTARPLIARFWDKVGKSADPHACWGWKASVNKDGYGWINLGSGQGMAHAHRVSWVLNIGFIPSGKSVLHSCDNPPCTNPRHLFLGTQIDNMADMSAKGRRVGCGGNVGERNGAAKLTPGKVRKIRNLYALGLMSQAALGGKFGLTQGPIGQIIRRETWKHVP